MPPEPQIPVVFRYYSSQGGWNWVLQRSDMPPGMVVCGETLARGETPGYSFWIPLHDQGLAGLDEAIRQFNAKHARLVCLDRRILAVNDDEAMHDLFRLILGRYGFLVESAPNGEAGLALLNSHDVDLLLVDNMMPVMSGYEMIRRVRADPRWNALPIVTCDIRAKTGVDSYFTIPFLPMPFAEAVSELIRNGRTNPAIRR